MNRVLGYFKTKVPRGVNRERGELGFTLDAWEWFFGTLIVLALLSMFKALIGVHGTGAPMFDTYWQTIVTWYQSIEIYVKIISWTLSGGLVFGVFYASMETKKIYEKEKEKLYPKEQEEIDVYANKKWERVLEHIESKHDSDWKLAVIEADIMLDELLDKSGYVGDSMGDKLKQVDKSDFRSIDQAWEAHKVRNAIAHEGSEYGLTEKEARRIIKIYENIFKEFHYI